MSKVEYHLFRLPEEVEQDLHALMQSSVGEDLASKLPKSKDAALNALKLLGLTNSKPGEGPTAVGDIKDIDSTDVLSAIAGIYFSAFSQNAKSYPYLVNLVG